MSTIAKSASRIASSKKGRAAEKLSASKSSAKLKDTFKYVFENGMEVNGTIEQIEKVAASMRLKVDYKVLGHRPKGYYQSSSKGLVKMSEMNDFHIRRALLKEARDYYTNLYSVDDSNMSFLKKFTGMAENPVIIDLYTELTKR